MLTEKRKVGELFAQALEPSGDRQPYWIEGDTYIIAWAAGHLFKLADPHLYDAKLRKFDLTTLPIEPDNYRFIPISGREEHIEALTTLFSRDDIESLTIATDCGREGELIAHLCLQNCRWNQQKPTYRFWSSAALTEENILSGMAHRIPATEKRLLAEAGLARMRGDWHVGVNGTRALTCRLKTGQRGVIPTGRVQSCILRMIAERQEERENFIPEDFWTLKARFASAENEEIIATWVGTSDQDFSTSFLPENPEEDTEEIKEEGRSKRFKIIYDVNQRINAICPHGMTHRALKGVLKSTPNPSPNGDHIKAFIIDVVGADDNGRSGIRGEPGPKYVSPPQLFNSTTLMQEANSAFGMTMQRTAEVAQELYLDLGLITYPRTESKVLTGEMLDQVKTIFQILEEDRLIDFDPAKICFPVTETELPRVFNDKKIVEDHHAIIPSGLKPENLTPDQKKIYALIVRRFIAAFYPDYSYRSILISIQVGEDRFEARKSVLLEGGWKEYLKGKIKKSGTMASIEKMKPNQTLYLTTLYREQGKTVAPPPYNDATLLQAMTNIHNLIHVAEDAEEKEKTRIEIIKRTLRESSGLGTSASRPGIVAKMVKEGIILRLGRGKGFEPSNIGRLVFNALKSDSVTDYENSAIWELKLDRIERREGMTSQLFMKDIKLGVRSLVDHIRGLPNELVQLVDHVGSCPICGLHVVNRPKSYSCEDYPNCSFVLWKNKLSRFNKKEITREEAQTLLKKQPVPLKKLSGKDQKTFSRSGYLSYSTEYGWGISFKEDDYRNWPKAKSGDNDDEVSSPSNNVSVVKPVRSGQPKQKSPEIITAVDCCPDKGDLPKNLPPRPTLKTVVALNEAIRLWREKSPGVSEEQATKYFQNVFSPLVNIPEIMKADGIDPSTSRLPDGINSHLQLLKKGLEVAVQEWVRKHNLSPSFSVFQRVSFPDEGFEKQGTISAIKSDRGTYFVSISGGDTDSVEVPWEQCQCFKCHATGAFQSKVSMEVA